MGIPSILMVGQNHNLHNPSFHIRPVQMEALKNQAKRKRINTYPLSKQGTDVCLLSLMQVTKLQLHDACSTVSVICFFPKTQRRNEETTRYSFDGLDISSVMRPSTMQTYSLVISSTTGIFTQPWGSFSSTVVMSLKSSQLVPTRTQIRDGV